jgi:hypothetical protein
MPPPRRLADFRLELAEAIESFGENWFSWGNWLGALPDQMESWDREGITQNQYVGASPFGKSRAAFS